MAKLFWLCQVTLCLTSCLARVLHDVTANTRYGDVVGERRQEDYDIGNGKVTDVVDVYMGIPYALPPIGDNRFKPPRPPAKWKEPLEARIPGPVCPQKPYYRQTVSRKQSEDCLNLNIYSPYQGDNVTGGLPVMLYVHGGSHEEGAGSRYNGFTLAQHGVVIVTINYRLGLLGFLTNGKPSLSGNYGLLDQVEALRWVSDNIGRFRGDPCRVTVFGSSAGSASIGLLMTAPLARGLFNQAILQSGSPLAFWAIYNSTTDFGSFFDDVTTFMGCGGDDDDERLNCMREIHYSNFTDVYENFTRITPSKAIFKPRVDGDLVPDRPRSLFRAGLYRNMSVMIGHVANEWNRNMGWFLEDLDGVDSKFGDGFERSSLEASVHHVIEKRFWWPRELADAVIFEYTDWSRPADAFDNRHSYASLMSDLVMVAPAVELVDVLAGQGSPVYHYSFNHSSTHTEQAWFGSYHTLELDYVFGAPFTGYNMAVDGFRTHTEDDKTVSRTVMELWTNFAKQGNPSTGQIAWEPMNTSMKNYLYISAARAQTQYHIRPQKMAFWNILVPQLLNIATDRQGGGSLERPTDMKLTLMWFFGILSFLSFIVMLAVVVRNGNIKKQLTKAIALSSSPQGL